LLCGEEDGTISIFDLTKLTENKTSEKPSDTGIRSISVSSNGKIVATANNNGEVIIWNKDGCSLTKIQNFKAHSKYILKLAICPNGKYKFFLIKN
jgi:G protein beta subunit-like protein